MLHQKTYIVPLKILLDNWHLYGMKRPCRQYKTYCQDFEPFFWQIYLIKMFRLEERAYVCRQDFEKSRKELILYVVGQRLM